MANVALESVTVTADGTAFTGKGDLYGISVSGTVESTAIVYDNTAASGTIIACASRPGIFFGGNYVQFETGLQVDLTTAGHVTVYFVRR